MAGHTVIYYISVSGENPVSDFLDSLSGKQQSKLSRIINYIEIYGLQSVLPHVKKITKTPLWEIRVLGKDNLRIIYALFINNQVLALHGFIKKSPKTPPKEIRLALNRYSDWVKRHT